MKYWNKLRLTLCLATSFCCAVSLFGGEVLGATTAPVVSVLSVIRDGAVTPTRMTEDGLGNIYVTDPHAEGILKYDQSGVLVQKIITAKEPGGIAIAKNGDILVTQGTYVAVLNPSGVEYKQFGVFQSAFSIAVDNRPAGTGNIFVSDIKGYCIQVFDAAYAPVDVSAGNAHNPFNPSPGYGTNFIGDSFLIPVEWTYDANGILPDYATSNLFNRPAGVAIEKSTGKLAVVDSLNGKVKFFTQTGNAAEVIGGFGYDTNHQFVLLTYPQSIAFEYTAGGALDRAYILDTFQSYVMVLDATSPLGPTGWSWLADIGLYGHHNGDLIVPSDILIDKFNTNNNRLLVSNGFGSVSVFGLSSLQPYNVSVDSITNTSMRINWSNSSAAFDAIRIYRSEVEGQLGIQVGGDIAKGGTTQSYIDTGLAQYTTYFYTVRAVKAGTPTNNVDQISAKTTGTFNLTLTINGNGQVNGTLSCVSGSACNPLPLQSDSLVTLTATATGQSVFSGWTGDCFTTAETCLITMDMAKSVTAFFTPKLAFRVDGAYFDNLQEAYSDAKDGSVIKVLAGTWPSTTHPTEYMTAWQAKSVTIEGGYDATFTNNAGGSSTVTGRTNLNRGKVVMKQFKLK